MYKSHPAFKPPPRGALLWKYVDFTKFVSLLERQALFFSTPEKFSDPFEGHYPLGNLKGLPDESAQGLSTIARDMRNFVLVDCWHWNEVESAAMWKVYSEWERGIAIQTTVGALQKSLIGPHNVFIGKVKYIDYDKQQIDRHNVLIPYLTKRKSFAHEREVRAIRLSQEPHQDGTYQKVDLVRLVRSVMVAPESQDWFVDLVESVLDRYGLTVPVSRSSLAAPPAWISGGTTVWEPVS